MSREVRRVPANYSHPIRNGKYLPLLDGYKQAAQQWDREEKKHPADHEYTYTEWVGERPSESNYMADYSCSERTHYQMFETVSEGTPVSPVMDSPERLAQWLADNNAFIALKNTATYEEWLSIIKTNSYVMLGLDTCK